MADLGTTTTGEKVLEVEDVEPIVKHESHVQCDKSPELIANKDKTHAGDQTKENNNTGSCSLDKMDAENKKVVADEKGHKPEDAKSNDVNAQLKTKEVVKEKSIENAKESSATGGQTVSAEPKAPLSKDIKDAEISSERYNNKGATNNIDTSSNKGTVATAKSQPNSNSQPNSKMYDPKNFVEAPIPKTNAWAKKTTTAPPASSSGTTTEAKAINAVPSSRKEPSSTAAEGSFKSKTDDKANALTTSNDTASTAKLSPAEVENKNKTEDTNAERPSNSTKPIQSVDKQESTGKDSSRGWWGPSAAGSVPAPVKKIPQKAEEEKVPPASGNQHVSLPKTSSPKIDKTRGDGARPKTNLAHEKQSPVGNPDAAKRQVAKSEVHSPAKLSSARVEPKNKGDTASATSASAANAVDLVVGGGQELKERADKLGKSGGSESAAKASTLAASKSSGEEALPKDQQTLKVDEKKKSKWSDAPTPTKEDSQSRGGNVTVTLSLIKRNFIFINLFPVWYSGKASIECKFMGFSPSREYFLKLLTYYIMYKYCPRKRSIVSPYHISK